MLLVFKGLFRQLGLGRVKRGSTGILCTFLSRVGKKERKKERKRERKKASVAIVTNRPVSVMQCMNGSQWHLSRSHRL